MNLREQIKEFEGSIPHAYQDHLGFWTVGVGRLIDKRKGGRLSDEEIDFLLDNDLARVKAEVLEALPWAKNLNEPRQAVLFGMAFQMGKAGLLGFRTTLEHVRTGRYESAAANMKKSLWFKQTPKRAQRLADQMLTGRWS